MRKINLSETGMSRPASPITTQVSGINITVRCRSISLRPCTGSQQRVCYGHHGKGGEGGLEQAEDSAEKAANIHTLVSSFNVKRRENVVSN